MFVPRNTEVKFHGRNANIILEYRRSFFFASFVVYNCRRTSIRLKLNLIMESKQGV